MSYLKDRADRWKPSTSKPSLYSEPIRQLLADEPNMTTRALANRVGCSPAMAWTWKRRVEKGLL